MPGGIFSENLPHIVLCILNKGVVAAQEYGRQYVALFHWKKERENVRVDCRCAGICTEPSYRELWSGTGIHAYDSDIVAIYDCGSYYHGAGWINEWE